MTWLGYSGGLPASLGHSGRPVAGEGRLGVGGGENLSRMFIFLGLRKCEECAVDVGERWKGGVWECDE